MANDLLELYEYGSWANHRLFDALAQLSTEKFTQRVARSYGSIRNTLVHAMSAEWGLAGTMRAQPDRGNAAGTGGLPL